jgi:hypothetical protein
MNIKKVFIIAAAVIVTCMLITIAMQDRKIEKLTAERDRYQANTEALLEQTQTYKIQDSLNAVRVGTLELTVKELEKYRAEDAKLAQDLKRKNEDLERLNKAQMKTIEQLRCVPRDTVIQVDSVYITAKAVHCGDEWYKFDGLVTEDEFRGTLQTWDELVLTETVQYKRFLFWRTKKVKDRSLEAVSKNPHTEITGLEHIIIDR